MSRRDLRPPGDRDGLGWSGRWIARMLRVYPSQFRRDFGEDIVTAFLDQRDEIARDATFPRLAVVATTFRVSWHLFKAGAVERMIISKHHRRLQAKGRKDNMFETTLADIKYAVRGFARRPGFTTTALVTLALGIGATTTIFSVVNGVLLKPLSFDEPEDLVGVWHSVPSRGSGTYPLSPGTYFTYRDESRVFDDIGLWRLTQVTVTGLEAPERVPAMQVTDGTFPVLRVDPVLGRRFTAADDTRGTPLTVMLGNSYWRRRFGADPAVIGQILTMNGV